MQVFLLAWILVLGGCHFVVSFLKPLAGEPPAVQPYRRHLGGFGAAARTVSQAARLLRSTDRGAGLLRRGDFKVGNDAVAIAPQANGTGRPLAEFADRQRGFSLAIHEYNHLSVL